MSSATELLNELNNSEPHIIIGLDRTITVPDSLRQIAVQHDHNIETVTFDCPRYWDGHDFSNMSVYINYKRSDGYMDAYVADNVSVDESDEKLIHFSWTISRNVTEVKGKLTILVCIKSNVDDEEAPHWNSRLNQDLEIAEGLECEAQYLETTPDVIENILNRLSAIEATLGITEGG